MSTYLVAFLVSDFTFKQAEQTGNDVIFKIWTRKDAINQVKYPTARTGAKTNIKNL